MRLGGLNVGTFFGAQPDTPAKIAGFAYAFEHLEIADRILAEERAAAETIAATWDAAMDASLGDLLSDHSV